MTHTPGPWKAAPKGDGWHITAEAPKGLYGLYTFILLAVARQYAAECATCDGTGTAASMELSEPRGRDCPDCTDIRQVIAKATGAA